MGGVRVAQFPKARVRSRPIGEDTSWHRGADVEILAYAQTLQRAASVLVEKWEMEPEFRTALDACPVFRLYQESLELRLKAVVSDGNGFLKTETDSITLYTTHATRWLAQIVCRIIKRVGWENEFRCEGISGLPEFIALVDELEDMEFVIYAIHCVCAGESTSAERRFESIDIVRLASRLDALLELLDMTADALAAAWDFRLESADLEATVH